MFELLACPARALFNARLQFGELIDANERHTNPLIDQSRVDPVNQLGAGMTALMLGPEVVRFIDHQHDPGPAERTLPLSPEGLPTIFSTKPFDFPATISLHTIPRRFALILRD